MNVTRKRPSARYKPKAPPDVAGSVLAPPAKAQRKKPLRSKKCRARRVPKSGG